MSNWKIVFKNGTEIHVKGGREVISAADITSRSVILQSLLGRQLAVNASEVLYVVEEER